MDFPFDAAQVAAVAVTLLGACVIQSAVGFGSGLVAIPILIWWGVALPHAIAVVLTASLLMSAAAMVTLHRETPWRAVAAAATLRTAGLFAGIAILGLIVTLDIARIKQLVGATVLAAVLMQWLGKVRPRERIGWPWSVAAFLSSGVLAGMVGMGGPPIVLWALAHPWSTARTRAFLLGVLGLLVPINLALLAWRFGSGVLAAALTALACGPVLAVGTAVGLRIGRSLSPQLLRRLALGLLTLLAVSSLLAPLLN